MKSMHVKWYIVYDFLQNDIRGGEVDYNNDESQSAGIGNYWSWVMGVWEVSVFIYLFIHSFSSLSAFTFARNSQ